MLLIAKKATKDQMEKMARHFSGYIKVVVDLEKEILVGGADRHVDEEQMLLNYGSKQSNLWGGGVEITTNVIDYNSIINLRPMENPSREILDKDKRKRFDAIVIKLLM